MLYSFHQEEIQKINLNQLFFNVYCIFLEGLLVLSLMRGVIQVIEACFKRPTKKSSVDPVAYENFSSFSLRLMYISQKNGYQFLLESKQHRLIECLSNNHKSFCMLAYGYYTCFFYTCLSQFINIENKFLL